jgi:hypothetical protein
MHTCRKRCPLVRVDLAVVLDFRDEYIRTSRSRVLRILR